MLAILLICAATIAPRDCNEANALTTQTVHVANQLACMAGAELSAAALPAKLDGTEYVRVECRREKN